MRSLSLRSASSSRLRTRASFEFPKNRLSKCRTALRLDYGNYVIWGPEDPSSKEMFAAVQEFTRGDDKVGFFRARAMNLYTDRQSVQLTTLPDILDKADYYAMAKDSTYSQKLLTDQEAADAGLTKVWENPQWVLWRVPPR